MGRATPFIYVKLAMTQLNNTLHNAHFWIDTDSPHWLDIQTLKSVFPNRVSMLFEVAGDFNVLDTFYHMIRADALIMSYSSFSNAAAFLSRNGTLLVAPPKGLGRSEKYLREGIFTIPHRFLRISTKAVKRHFMATAHPHNPPRVTPFVGKSERSLLALVDKAEVTLKVFVYPIPRAARRCTAAITDYRYEMETRLHAYFLQHKLVHTNNTDEADLFLIQHEWVCLLLVSVSCQLMCKDTIIGY